MAGATNIPETLRYTKDHEWVKLEAGNVVRMGITDYAQDALTDVVFVELPDVDDTFAAHDSMGIVESVKSVSDIFAPLAGRIVEVNTRLDDSPELLNTDPYGEGWFCAIAIEDPAVVDRLMSAADYRKLVEQG